MASGSAFMMMPRLSSDETVSNSFWHLSVWLVDFERVLHHGLCHGFFRFMFEVIIENTSGRYLKVAKDTMQKRVSALPGPDGSRIFKAVPLVFFPVGLKGDGKRMDSEGIKILKKTLDVDISQTQGPMVILFSIVVVKV